jgi:hypothetical protein
MRRKLLILLGLLSFTVALGAQEEGVGQGPTRRLLVYFQLVPGSDLSEREGVLLYETLLIELADASQKLAVKDFREAEIPPSDIEKTETAEQRKADCWLEVVVSGNTDVLQIQVRSLDMLSGQLVLDETLEKELRRGIRDLQRLFWADVTAPLADYYSTAFSKDVSEGTLVFEALPGTRIGGSAWKKLQVDAEGQTSVQVPLPATLPYRATKPGYWPVEGEIYMDQTRKVLALEQERGVRFALDVYLQNLSYPGFDFMYFFVPDTVFARIGFLTYLLGIVFDDREDSRDSIFVSHSLNNIVLSAGTYLNAPDRVFRPYLAAGCLLRLVTAKGYWGLEPIAPLALQPVFGLEYGRSPRFKLYAEYAPYIYWVPDRFLFALSIPEDRNIKFLVMPLEKNVGDSVRWAWIWEAVLFQVGLRVRL